MSSEIKFQYVNKPMPVFTSVLDDHVEMNKYLKQVILEHREKYPKSNNSNVKAWHSAWNTHEINPKFQPILDRTLGAVKFIHKKYFNMTEWTLEQINPCISSMWAMMYDDNNWTERHSHMYTSDIFVAAYYVDVGKKSSPIIFEDVVNDGIHDNNKPLIIQPENGMLIIWPAILYHEVPPTKEKRMCISMNFKHKEKIK
tara:strand:+ start:49 stop:645 length:597 start_codon:yes stop_codon:yes gene_type:complete